MQGEEDEHWVEEANRINTECINERWISAFFTSRQQIDKEKG